MLVAVSMTLAAISWLALIREVRLRRRVHHQWECTQQAVAQLVEENDKLRDRLDDDGR